MSTPKIWRQALAPEGRIDPSEHWIIQQNPRLSSVVAVVANTEENPQLLLTRRVQYTGVHSGQMSFPGGKKEPEETFLETALRETREEVGFIVEEHHISHTLSPLYIPPSNHWVHPFVAVLPHLPEIILQKTEVAYSIWVPWEKVQSAQIVYEQVGDRAQVPGFNFDDDFVWGATAMLLNEIRKTLLL